MPPQSPLQRTGRAAITVGVATDRVITPRRQRHRTRRRAVATSDPCTLRYAQPVALALDDRPGAEVSVTPGRHRQRVAAAVEDRASALPVHGSDELTVTVSLDSCTPLRPLPLPELPFSAPMSMFALCDVDRGPGGVRHRVSRTVGTPTGDATLIPSPVIRSIVLLVIDVVVWLSDTPCRRVPQRDAIEVDGRVGVAAAGGTAGDAAPVALRPARSRCHRRWCRHRSCRHATT